MRGRSCNSKFIGKAFTEFQRRPYTNVIAESETVLGTTSVALSFRSLLAFGPDSCGFVGSYLCVNAFFILHTFRRVLALPKTVLQLLD